MKKQRVKEIKYRVQSIIFAKTKILDQMYIILFFQVKTFRNNVYIYECIGTKMEIFFWKDKQKKLVTLSLGRGPRVERGNFSIFTFCTTKKFPA